MNGTLADIDAERALLSVVLDVGGFEPARLVALSDEWGLTPGRFSDEANGEIYRAALALAKAGKAADTVSVSAALAGSDVVKKAGGPAFISKIEAAGGIEAAAAGYAETVRGYALRRELAEIVGRVRSLAFDEARPPAETLAELLQSASAIQVRGAAPKLLSDVLTDCITQIQENQRGNAPKLVPTGIAHLDNALGGGLQPAVLTLVGAEPGVGKSAILASIASNAAQAGFKVGVFSLEDGAEWLAWRVLAHHSRIPQPVLKYRVLSDGQRARLVPGVDACATYSDRVLVDDRCGLTPGEICQSASAMIVQHGVEVILVDHLGEVRFEGRGDRYDLAVGDGLRQIRDVAKRHKIPIVVASQLARRKGRGPGDLPEKSDFRNSGDIEAIARVMLGLSREPGSDTMKIGILKNTNGSNGVALEAQFYGIAAMVRSIEGEVVDLYADREDAK